MTRTPAATAVDVDVVRLAPPHLNDHNLGRRRTCVRPLRTGGPRWEVEQLSSGLVVHNYGHGPAGWTLAPGSAALALDLLHQHMRASAAPLPLDAPIAVVGAGVIGLFTARALLAAGYSRVALYAAETDDLTSHRAGGFLAPAGLVVDDALRPTLQRVALTSYDEWKRIATAPPHSTVHSATYPFAAYVHRYPAAADVHGLQCYVESGRMAVRDVVVDFGAARRPMQVYEGGVFMQTGRLMRELLTDVQQRGALLHRQHVPNLAALHAAGHLVIYNCAGHAASALAGDPRAIGALGHTIALCHQPPPADHAPYSLSMYAAEVCEGGLRIKRATYVHPRCGDSGDSGDVGLLGGTVVRGVASAEELDAERNEREWALVVERARVFFYGEQATEWGGGVLEIGTAGV